jgi:hypothetical protein
MGTLADFSLQCTLFGERSQMESGLTGNVYPHTQDSWHFPTFEGQTRSCVGHLPTISVKENTALCESLSLLITICINF